MAVATGEYHSCVLMVSWVARSMVGVGRRAGAGWVPGKNLEDSGWGKRRCVGGVRALVWIVR